MRHVLFAIDKQFRRRFSQRCQTLTVYHWLFGCVGGMLGFVSTGHCDAGVLVGGKKTNPFGQTICLVDQCLSNFGVLDGRTASLLYRCFGRRGGGRRGGRRVASVVWGSPQRQGHVSDKIIHYHGCVGELIRWMYKSNVAIGQLRQRHGLRQGRGRLSAVVDGHDRLYCFQWEQQDVFVGFVRVVQGRT